MKEIKFRAFIDRMVPDVYENGKWTYKHHKEMKEVKSLHIGTGKITVSKKGGNYSVSPGCYILMQYINNTDKNGVKIYEDDIVKWSYANVQGVSRVIFEKNKFNLEKFYLSSLCCPNDAFSEDVVMEVIGNIHENEELLNECG